jgi:carbon-monoxide dehydrogenase medium subunit
VEEAIAGRSMAEASERATEGTEPSGDINATPEYREHLVRVLVRRALEAASA